MMRTARPFRHRRRRADARLRPRLPAASSPGFAQLAFSDKADGSLIERDGKVVGSKLAAQAFTKPEYFHPRPSATAPEYNAAATTFANLGPTNPDLAKAVRGARARDPRSSSARTTPASRSATSPSTPSRPPPRASTRTSRRPTRDCRRRASRRSAGSPRSASQELIDEQHGRPLARHLRRAGRERARAQPRSRRGDADDQAQQRHLHARDRLRGDRRLVPEARPADALPQPGHLHRRARQRRSRP